MILNCSASEASANASYNLTVQQERKTQQRVCCANCTHHSSETTAHTGAQTQPAKQYSTSRTFPTKDAPLLMKHLLVSAPCTPDRHATVASAPSQNLDKGTWSGVCTNSARSQPAFKHCQQHHLTFCVWTFWGVVIGYFLSVLGLCCFTLSE